MRLTDIERERAIFFMKRYGGSFMKALAEAYICADLENRRKIEAAFETEMRHYASPGWGTAYKEGWR